MKFSVIATVTMLIVVFAAAAVSVYLLLLIIKALKTYIRSKEVRGEKTKNARSMGEVLKQHRVACRMTQEFVAETIGVSRQAVSKWENGTSDPSTTNLMALAKLFGVEAEELLKEARP
ncbi:MAG: helix-turn-helix transcriptional regulator [Lachnospiraceae bacterium]|nr:helix-turn-helix transcriptional regulator [Lachnospiraceae bacterium]